MCRSLEQLPGSFRGPRQLPGKLQARARGCAGQLRSSQRLWLPDHGVPGEPCLCPAGERSGYVVWFAASSPAAVAQAASCQPPDRYIWKLRMGCAAPDAGLPCMHAPWLSLPFAAQPCLELTSHTLQSAVCCAGAQCSSPMGGSRPHSWHPCVQYRGHAARLDQWTVYGAAPQDEPPELAHCQCAASMHT